VFLPGSELGLTGELLLWAREQGLADDEPLFFSRKRGAEGSHRPLQRGQAWLIVKEASAQADVCVLALRTSKHGLAGEAAPIHPHLLRHARVRQIVRQTKSLPLAQRQAGWSRLVAVVVWLPKRMDLAGCCSAVGDWRRHRESARAHPIRGVPCAVVAGKWPILNAMSG
jgi:hypothetical protein